MSLTSASLHPRSTARVIAWAVGLGVPLVFLSVFFAWPVVTLIGRGLVVDGRLDLGGFLEVFEQQRTWRVISQTLVQAVSGTVLSLALGIPGAYALYRLKFRGQRVLRAIVTTPFVLPTVVVGV